MGAQYYFIWEVAYFSKDGYLARSLECTDYSSALWIARRWLRHDQRRSDDSGQYQPLAKLCYMPTRRYNGKRYLADPGRLIPKERCYRLVAYTNGAVVQELVIADTVAPAVSLGRLWMAEQLGNTYRIWPKHRLFKCANGMPTYFRYPSTSHSAQPFGV